MKAAVHNPHVSIQTWLQRILLAAAGYYLVILAGLVSVRLFYPYELEWIEGAYVNEAAWVSAGNFPYGPPSLAYLPTSKTPLFFYAAGFLMKLLGEGFVAPRLVSVLSLAASLLIIYRLVAQGRRWTVAGFVAAGLYAATFRFTGAWMDLAKTDSMFLCLLVLAFAIGLRYPRRGMQVISGGLFALAFFTKQITLPVVLVAAPISLIATRGRTWLQWAVAALLGLTAFAGMEIISQGWFSFYTLQTSTHHARVTDLIYFWKLMLPKMLPSLVLVCAYGLSVLRQTNLKQRQWPETDWMFLGLGGGLVLASWSIFLKSWTYDNGLMPASLGLALLSGVALMHFTQAASSALSSSRSKWVANAGYLLAFFQFLLLFYPPLAQLPTTQDRAAGATFLGRLKALPGSVWVFDHSAYAPQVGKPTFFHSAPFGDVMGADVAGDPTLAQKQQAVRDVFSAALISQELDWVIVDKRPESWMPYYIPVETLVADADDFIPVTGAPARPAQRLARNPLVDGGELPIQDALYDALFVQGWQPVKDALRWTSSTQAVVQIALKTDADYAVEVELQPMCTDSQPTPHRVTLGWGEHPLGEINFTNCLPLRSSFDLPAAWIAPGLNDLWLAISDEASSVGLSALSFVPK